MEVHVSHHVASNAVPAPPSVTTQSHFLIE